MPRKKKAGRPFSENPRTCGHTVRMSEEERTLLDEAVRRIPRKKTADYIRETVFKRVRRELGIIS